MICTPPHQLTGIANDSGFDLERELYVHPSSQIHLEASKGITLLRSPEHLTASTYHMDGNDLQPFA